MSSTSLYGNVGNVTVSSKNLTTLYNATTGNTVIANVPDRNFTTLYAAAGQSDIKPTQPYGNANVEAFLNVGIDGGNTVQNINMNGTLTVGGDSNLGDVSKVHIDGGTLNYILTTDGSGGLSWIPQSGIGNVIPYIHFDVIATGTNQSFVDSNLSFYNNVNEMNVMKNGVNIEPFYYTLVGNTLTMNIWLNTGDTVDVLATGMGLNVGGNITEVQYNGGGTLSGNSAFTFNQSIGQLNVSQVYSSNVTATSNLVAANGNITVGNITTLDSATITNNNLTSNNSTIGNIVINTSANLGDVSNVHIYGGTGGYVLSTDGAGTLSWVAQTGGGGNGTPGGANTQVQFNNAGIFGGVNVLTYNGANLSLTNVANLKIPGGSVGQSLTTYGNGTMYWSTVSSSPGGSNTQMQFNNNGVLGGTPILTYNGANVLVSNVANFKMPGGTTGQVLTTYGNGTVYWSTVSSGGNAATSLNAPIGNVIITGGSVGQVLTTYGTGVLYWAAPTAGLTGKTDGNVVALGNNAYNTAVGGTVLIGDNANSSGGSGVAVGKGSGAGIAGTFVGAYSGSNVTGSYNVGLGVSAGSYVTGDYNILIGPDCSFGNTITGSNNILLGRNAQASSNSASGEMTLGGSFTSSVRIPYGDVTITGNVNLNSTTTLLDATVSGNLIIQRAFEKVSRDVSPSTGTYNYNVSSQSIVYKTANASANVTVNLRGNASVTFDSLVPNNNSVTVVFLNTVGATPYINNVLTIDGTTQSVKWVNGNGPTVGTRLSNAVQSYTYTVMKYGVATYSVIGSLTEYQ